MILYHGSNVGVSAPKLLKKQRTLDFGNGFYTTSDFEQAKKWAVRTQRIRKEGKACVTAYEIDEKSMEKVSVLHFEKPNHEWLHFVVENRKGIKLQKHYDIISGPVANDQTMQTLVLYMDGFLTEEAAIAQLLPQKLKDQFVFKTEQALMLLKYKGVKGV